MRRLLIGVIGLGLFLGWQASGRADDFASLCAERAAIERVYYRHRSGEKLPFEQTLPEAALEKLVREDQAKEAALKKVYGVEITPALLEAEVRRINATTVSVLLTPAMQCGEELSESGYGKCIDYSPPSDAYGTRTDSCRISSEQPDPGSIRHPSRHQLLGVEFLVA